MARRALAVLAGVLFVFLAGCGGGGNGSGGPVVPPNDGGSSQTVQVGPLLVRPASAAGFVAQEIPNPNGPVSLAALHGSRITYLASQAMLDRIVFSREQSGGDYDIWVCDLDGSNAVKLLDNAFSDRFPAWSPDGTQIAFTRLPTGQDNEIIVMSAGGSSPHALTVNAADDLGPTWSPNGDSIAYYTNVTGNFEIFTMYADGVSQVNRTVNAAADSYPDWSPDPLNPFIVFSSSRESGTSNLWRMGPAGQNPTRLTQGLGGEVFSDCSPDGSDVVASQLAATGYDLIITSAAGLSVPRFFQEAAGNDLAPAWSSDGRFICWATNSGSGDGELWLRETAAPFRRFQITQNTVWEQEPDLGSPTLQTDRVIIGPAGSDWGGANPIWSSSDAGIVAWAADGYRNFMRIGVPGNRLSTLEVTPLTGTAVAAGAPLGVVVEAADIVNLREDGGRGEPTRLWQLDPFNATAVVLYFDPQTGKLLSVLVLADQVSPAAAAPSGAAVTQRAQAGGTVAEGSFAAVFDATGARIADGASEVSIVDGVVSVVR